MNEVELLTEIKKKMGLMIESQTTPIHLMLVENRAVVRIGLRTILRQHPRIEILAEAETLAIARTQVKSLKPHVLLLDIHYPDGSGVEACRQLLAECPATRVIFLTSLADEESMLTAVVAGAWGYLSKDIQPDVLVRAIETVADGHSILDPTVTQRLRTWLPGKVFPREVTTGRELSTQQGRILALVAEGKTNKEIGSVLKLSSNTVRNYLRKIFEKLQITRRTQAAAFFAKQHSLNRA